GAGKTTLIGVTTGLVTMTGGTVQVFGVDIQKEPEKAREHIGLVPQEMNFNIFEKVIDIVVNQAGYYGISRRVALPRAEELLKKLGLYEKRNEISLRLSGGMKRRLLIARALIHEPRFLILDEPTAGVDVELRHGMWEFLKTLTAQGVTILLTTHYLEEAEQLCNNIAIIQKGSIIAHGTMKELLSKLQHETLILDCTAAIPDAVISTLGMYNARRVDEHTIEVDLAKEQRLSDVVLLLERHTIAVVTIRNKSGRLEEVFLRLTDSKQ
ncbi:MAG: ABC transporter ATP-binding protein, partial [Patescibacteria group bacterium]